MNKRLVVFAPHPDDETLGCGGTILKRLEEGYDVNVVVITDGRHAFSVQGVYINPTPLELKEIRKKEAIMATQALGIPRENLMFWDFEDRTLESNSVSLAKKSIDLLTAMKPDEVFIPYEKDSNKDHRAASHVLQDCLVKLDFPVNAYQYSVAMRFLHFGPFLARLLNFFKHNLVFVDTCKYNAQKTAALREFVSQKEYLLCGNGSSAGPKSFFLKKYEVFFSLKKNRP